MIGDAAKFFDKNLENYEPTGRAACLCGSGEKFKNCCKDSYKQYNYVERKIPEETPRQRLRRLRAHVTWYRLCHKAHTLNLINFDRTKGEYLADVDAKALDSLIDELESAYNENGISSKFSSALEEFRFAIEHESWSERIDAIAGLYFYVRCNDLKKAQSILKKYDTSKIKLAELVELYIDVFSESLSHIDLITLADRVVALSNSEASKLQYRMLSAIQHFMLKNPVEGEARTRKAIEAYLKQPESKRSYYGNYRLAGAYKALGEIVVDDSLVEKAIECYSDLLNEENLREEFVSELWYEMADCYRTVKKYDHAEKLYRRSLLIDSKDIVKVFLARVLVSKGGGGEARTLLEEIDSSGLEDANFFDFAISWCALATASKTSEDIEMALGVIKKVTSKDPYFMDLHRSLIINMYELRSSNDAEKAKSSLEKINAYITINPSVFGVGVNFNAIFSDLLKRKK